MTEAAAIEKLSESPLTTVCTAAVMGGAIVPSTSATSGRIPSIHGARHRQQRRAQDVDAVDFVHAGRADPDPRGSAIDAPPERAVAGLALFAAQHLRIVELVAEHLWKTAGVENHGGRDYWSSERSPPGLVDAAHQPLAPAFKREIRHAPLLVPCGGRFGKRGRRRGTR
jgi:hypothetical protein